jgi:hypothetical protein
MSSCSRAHCQTLVCWNNDAAPQLSRTSADQLTARDVIPTLSRGHGHFSATANTTQFTPSIHQHERNNTRFSTCEERKHCFLQPRDAQVFVLPVDSIPRRLLSKSPMAHFTAITLLLKAMMHLQTHHCSQD